MDSLCVDVTLFRESVKPIRIERKREPALRPKLAIGLSASFPESSTTEESRFGQKQMDLAAFELNRP